ncbi:hypothetical protein ThvES_00007120 [Thiovulum sp. ES]|nr:hypothetical protein ThvES_00007120 [Thiovulum sp. ES]
MAIHVGIKVATGKANEITFKSVAINAVAGFINPIGDVPIGNLGTLTAKEIGKQVISSKFENLGAYGAQTLSSAIIESQISKQLSKR